MEIKNRVQEIKQVKISDLKPNPLNMNRHSKEQIQRLAKLIEYQGFRNPVVVSNQTGLVNSGHGRIDAAKVLKMKTVPVIYQDFDNEDQEYASLVADNAIADWAELDMGLINNHLETLGPDFDLEHLGLEDFGLNPGEDADGQEKNELVELPMSVQIFFKNEQDAEMLYNELISRSFDCKIIL